MSTIIEKVRKEWKKNDDKRDAGLTTPIDIQRYNDISYGEDPVYNKLDVYRPKDQREKLPVIINIHGGGWVYGDKELYQFYGMSLAQRKFAVINFTYRLAPEHKFPAQLEDVNNVVKWMYQNAEQYLFDLEHVFLVGDSSGAHLTALYTEICVNPDYRKNYNIIVPNNFVPEGLALNCGVYTPIVRGNKEDADNIQALARELMPNQGDQEEIDLIDVTRHVTSKFPPVFLLTGNKDFCREGTARMDLLLKEHQLEHIFKIYGSKDCPLDHAFHLRIRDEIAQQCNEEESDFFKNLMK